MPLRIMNAQRECSIYVFPVYEVKLKSKVTRYDVRIAHSFFMMGARVQVE